MPQIGEGESEMTKHMVTFEVTQQSGNLFRHSERFTVAGLARVRCHECVADLYTDWSGEVRRYRAVSEKPFVICVISDHTSEQQDGNTCDHSKVKVYASSRMEYDPNAIWEAQEVAATAW